MPRCVTVILALAPWLLAACVELPQTALSAPPARVSPTTDAGRDDATERLRVGAWNVRKLGFESSKDTARIAAIIEQHFDLIALLEVVWSADDATYEILVEQLGPGWQLLRTLTPRPNLPSPHAEYYVVALRSARVGTCDQGSALEYVEDGDGSDQSPRRGLFLREPAFACFRTRGAGAGNDFVLGAYHAEWGSGAADAIASEVAHVDRAFDAMRARFPQERQQLLVGDFNLDSAALAPLTAASDRTRGAGSTLDTEGRISDHLYDHLLALGRASEAALEGDAEVLDVRGEAFDPKRFRAQISDHLPLVAQLRVSLDSD
jgi:hypothetical protein